jgi:hypothetical protein
MKSRMKTGKGLERNSRGRWSEIGKYRGQRIKVGGIRRQRGKRQRMVRV